MLPSAACVDAYETQLWFMYEDAYAAPGEGADIRIDTWHALATKITRVEVRSSQLGLSHTAYSNEGDPGWRTIDTSSEAWSAVEKHDAQTITIPVPPDCKARGAIPVELVVSYYAAESVPGGTVFKLEKHTKTATLAIKVVDPGQESSARLNAIALRLGLLLALTLVFWLLQRFMAKRPRFPTGGWLVVLGFAGWVTAAIIFSLVPLMEVLELSPWWLRLVACAVALAGSFGLIYGLLRVIFGRIEEAATDDEDDEGEAIDPADELDEDEGAFTDEDSADEDSD